MGGELVGSHLKRRWAIAAAKENRSLLSALRKSIEFQKVRNEPVSRWDCGSVLIFFERMRSILLDKYELAVGNADYAIPSLGDPPKSHLRNTRRLSGNS